METIFEKPTIGKFLEFCKMYPDTEVESKPKGCGSWRGVYAEACLFCEFGEKSTLSKFVPYLEELISKKVFYGYKGGEYRYNRETELNFECDQSSYTDKGNFERLAKDGWDVNEEVLSLLIKHFTFYGA